MSRLKQTMQSCYKSISLMLAIAILTGCGGTDAENAANNISPSPSSVAASSLLSSSLAASSIIRSSSLSSRVSSNAAISSRVSSSTGTAQKPNPPQDFTQLIAATDRVVLNWTPEPESVGITSYAIYRDQIQIAIIGGSLNAYQDFDVAPSKSYSYGISAKDAAGNWSFINTIFVDTPAAAEANSSSSSAANSSVITFSSSIAQSSLTSSSRSSSNSSINLSSSTSSQKLSSSSVTSSSSKAASSSSKAASSSSKAASSSSSAQPGALGATIEWSHPNQRENGKFLTLDEIGGYQIRYKQAAASLYNYIAIPGNSTLKYTFNQSVIGLEFEIATYDTKGIYSKFVVLPSN